jgi:hypothetical protein
MSLFLNPVAPSDTSSVDRFGSLLWTFSTIGTQSYLRLSGIILHRKTRDVWGKLHSTLVKIHQSSSDSTRIFIEDQLRRHELKMRIIYLILLAFLAFFMKSMQSLFVGSNSPSRSVLNILIGTILWSFHEILSITKSLWFVHVIDLTRIGFTALAAEQEALMLRAGSTNMKMKSTSGVMLPDYEALEGVTQILSEKFTIELGISIFYGSTMAASVLEQICQQFAKGNFTLFLIYIPDLFVHCLEICLLCNSGTWLIKEVSFVTVIVNSK